MVTTRTSSQLGGTLNTALPILKWVGGKRSLLKEIDQLLPEPKRDGTYFEPFLGAGAVLFSRVGEYKLVGSDTNSELVNLYSVIKKSPEKLIAELETYPNDKDFFYQLRNMDRVDGWKSVSELKKAARILYLNKTCFNGLYRVNSRGEFNVPFGNYRRPNIVDSERIFNLSSMLNEKLQNQENRIAIHEEDFSDVLKKAVEGDVVYFDPPYDPVSETSSFTGYSSLGFGSFDQKRLRDICVALVTENRAKVVVSNSATEQIQNLYSEPGLFNLKKVSAARSVAAKSSSRTPAQEFLITSK
jgi:DNA adenine methylase